MSSTNTVKAHHISIDLNAADLSAREWETAEPVQIDRYWSGEPAPPSRHAEARILWSDKAVYVRFYGQQNEPLVVSTTPQTDSKAMNLWDRDVCEIFIATDPNLVERYLEFEAAPNGEWLDVALEWTTGKREADWKIQSRMTAAGKIEPDRVIVAMRIPWSDWVPKPQTGERWRINLLRCVGRDPDRGYLAWQPTRTAKPNFHVPQVFGWLIFA
jgi:hypothetical protein